MAERSASKKNSTAETPGSSGRRRSSFGAPPTPAPTPTPISTPPPPPQRTVRDKDDQNSISVDEKKRKSDAIRRSVRKSTATPDAAEANDQLVVEENVQQQPEGSPPQQSPRPDVVEENVQEQQEGNDEEGPVSVDKDVEDEVPEKQLEEEDLVDVEVPEEDAEEAVEVSDEEEVEDSAEQQKDVGEDVQQDAQSTDESRVESIEDGDELENDEDDDLVIVPEERKPSKVPAIAEEATVLTKKQEKKASAAKVAKAEEREITTPRGDAERETRKEKKISLKAVARDTDQTRGSRSGSPRKDSEKKQSLKHVARDNDETTESKSPRKEAEKKPSLKAVARDNDETTTESKSPRKESEKKSSLKYVARDSDETTAESKSPRKETEKKQSLRLVEKVDERATRTNDEAGSKTPSPRKDADKDARRVSEKKQSLKPVERNGERENRSPRRECEKKASLKCDEKEVEILERSPRKSKKGSIRAVNKDITKASDVSTKEEQNLQLVGQGMQQPAAEKLAQECQLISAPPIRVSVLYSESDGKVLFLEGGKDFVDLLMNFLMLPLGTVMKLLDESKGDLAGLGAVVRLFQSVEKLEPTIMAVDKDVLMIPKADKESTHPIARPLAPQLETGYVRENLTFTVTDELEVFPTSTIKSIALLNELQVTNMADLKSMEVCIDTADVLRLLRASLTQKSVLNHVFRCRLPNQHEHDRCERCSVHCI